jgi:hypothetical protein
MSAAGPIPEDRPLTAEEATLVRWLLEHGNSDACGFLPQLTDARVVSHCPCGCASIDFAIGGAVPPAGSGLHVLSDYRWQAADESLFGVFVFAKGGKLAGLEVWSIDGRSAAASLPEVEQLRPLVLSPTA